MSGEEGVEEEVGEVAFKDGVEECGVGVGEREEAVDDGRVFAVDAAVEDGGVGVEEEGVVVGEGSLVRAEEEENGVEDVWVEDEVVEEEGVAGGWGAWEGD